jgi:vacuolar iron transporter family protein
LCRDLVSLDWLKGKLMSDTTVETGWLARLKDSLAASAGTIVFGMEDGTVSIFGLVFGVAATTNSNDAVLVAGASGAAAAAVSMMAGAFLESETDRDEKKARQKQLEIDLTCDPQVVDAMLAERLTAVGLERPQAGALAGAVRDKPDAIKALLLAMQGGTEAATNPIEQALWMLIADFFSAAVPIVPFMLLPVASARIVSAGITILLLVALGIGRGIIGKRSVVRTVVETVSLGIAAALAGVGIGVFFNNNYGGS